MDGHTPGPWFTFANGQCVGGPVGPLGNPSGADTAGVCHCGMGLRTGSEIEANARLIAAAPATRAALKNLLSVCTAMDADTCADRPTEEDYQAALSQAEEALRC